MNVLNSLTQLVTKLTNDNINFSIDTEYYKVILDSKNKPEGMSIPSWQFQLKLVAYFNQEGICICENRLTNIRELHHAILSRRDVQGCSQKIKNLIHHTYNVIEICKNCHMSVNRKKSTIFLGKLYGKENIIDWYNQFPLKTKIYRIESFFE